MKYSKLLCFVLAAIMTVSVCGETFAKKPKDGAAEKPAAEQVADKHPDPNAPTLMQVQQMPVFGKRGSLYEFREWAQREMKCPKSTLSALRQSGKSSMNVTVVFVVSTDGEACFEKALNADRTPVADEELVRELKRVVNLSPKWQPAVQDGRNVNIRFSMPVIFNAW